MTKTIVPFGSKEEYSVETAALSIGRPGLITNYQIATISGHGKAFSYIFSHSGSVRSVFEGFAGEGLFAGSTSRRTILRSLQMLGLDREGFKRLLSRYKIYPDI